MHNAAVGLNHQASLASGSVNVDKSAVGKVGLPQSQGGARRVRLP